MNETGNVQGWCFREDCEIEITYPVGIMGALFTCPHCGPIRETAHESQHISASGPLLDRLRQSQQLESDRYDLAQLTLALIRLDARTIHEVKERRDVVALAECVVYGKTLGEAMAGKG